MGDGEGGGIERKRQRGLESDKKGEREYERVERCREGERER